MRQSAHQFPPRSMRTRLWSFAARANASSTPRSALASSLYTCSGTTSALMEPTLNFGAETPSAPEGKHAKAKSAAATNTERGNMLKSPEGGPVAREPGGLAERALWQSRQWDAIEI